MIMSIYVAVYLFIIHPVVELFILIIEPFPEPLSRARSVKLCSFASQISKGFLLLWEK